MNKGRLLRVLLLVVIAAGIVLAIANRDQLDVAALEQWVNSAGIAAPLLFVMIYAVGVVLFLPALVFTLAGGALFGPFVGALVNLLGASVGSTLAFIVSRYLAGDWVTQRSGGRLKRIKEGVEAEGWRFVAFVRLVPLFPFSLLNYVLGLTRIKLSHYFFATLVFMIPGGVAYTYLGYAGKEAIGGGEGVIQKAMLALALIALVAFIPRFVGRMRRGPMISVETLKQRLDQNDGLLLLDVRSAEEFTGEQGHINKARNIPLDQLNNYLSELADYQEKSVALICRTDRRSAQAAGMLTRRGFADVHVVAGGMTTWISRGFPVKR